MDSDSDLYQVPTDVVENWISLNRIQHHLMSAHSNAELHTKMLPFTLPLVAKFHKIESLKKPGLQTEIRLLRKLDHTNIIKTFDALKQQVFQGSFVIVYEYGTQGNLFDFMLKNLRLEKYIVRDICVQLIIVHDQCICHRQISPIYVVIDSELVPKIIHFRDAVEFEEGKLDAQLTWEDGLSYMYAPPEVVKLKNSDTYSGKMADLWAMGMVLFYVATVKPFFEDEEKALEGLKDFKLYFPEKNIFGLPISLSDAQMKFFEDVFQENSASRLSLREMLLSEWLLTEAQESATNSNSPFI
ncbi:hypothetical protein Ciccas_007221 [Cichlidogyrus casuarinus]|uniref:Protein kinase domain-containing protein n=1 Tax=Cichlidogyrus casuarinus TaxID=1844966 RepID=A0ABD2Q4N2_9PLAT